MLQGSKTGDIAVSKMYCDHKTQNSGKNKVLLHAQYSALNRLQLQVEKKSLNNSKNCKLLDSASIHFSGGFCYTNVRVITQEYEDTGVLVSP